jgi:hypothetical protein
MDVAENAKPLTLDAQYIAQGNIMAIRMRFLDLARYQYAFMCQVKSHPNRMLQEDEFNHLLLIDHTWGECGEMEFIDLKGNQTGVRFYLPGPVELAEIDKYENAIRNNFSRPRIGLWLWENLGWTPKVIELFTEELYEHRVTSLQHIQGLAIDKLGLGTYPLSYFQIPPAPQTGISQMQSNSLQPTGGISQIQPESQRPQAGVILPQPENPLPSAWIFQNQPYNPNLQVGIPQIQTENSELETGVDRDIPREHPTKESEITLNKEDKELLRLWNNGLTAKEIGFRTGKVGKTISNRLSVLRGMYGEESVPLRKQPTRKV